MKKLLVLFVGLFFSAVAIFVVFPAEYARIFGLREGRVTLNKLALRLTKFYTLNGLKYSCGNEVYFRYTTPFGGYSPGLGENFAEILEEKNRIITLFISDTLGDEIDQLRDEMLSYNVLLSVKCLGRSTSS